MTNTKRKNLFKKKTRKTKNQNLSKNKNLKKYTSKKKKKQIIKKQGGAWGKSDDSYPIFYTQNAVDQIKIIGIDNEKIIRDILLNSFPKTIKKDGKEYLEFEKNNIIIITNIDRSKQTNIITIYKKVVPSSSGQAQSQAQAQETTSKLQFSKKALEIMQQENLSEQKIINILKSVQPIEAYPGPDGVPRFAYIKDKYSIITNYEVTVIITINVKQSEQFFSSSGASSSRNIPVKIDENAEYCRLVPGSIYGSYRSTISQPYNTHEVLDREGSRVHNSKSKNSYAIDCARCAAAYAGFAAGTSSLTELQQYAVANNGTSFSYFDKWLQENSSSKETAPKLYALAPNYLRKYDGCISAAARDFFNELLNENEQALAAFVKEHSTGHYFNVAKQAHSVDPKQHVWYIDPQTFKGPGNYTIAQALQYYTRKDSKDPIINVLVVLIPEQAKNKWLSEYVVPANYNNPRHGWWTKQGWTDK